MDVSTRAQYDILSTQSGHLGEAQSGLNGEQEKGMVAPSIPSALNGSREQAFNLGMGQEPNQPMRLVLIGNGEDLLDSGRLRRFLEGDIAEERANRGQAKVAGASRVVAIGLAVIEKRGNQWGIEVLPSQLRGCPVFLALNEFEQQSKSISIRGDGMGAHIPLVHEPFGEKALEERGHAGSYLHGCTSH